MYAREILKRNEDQVLVHNRIISNVSGKKKSGGKLKKFLSISATGFLIAFLLVICVIFSSGNIIPSAISERLIEETDVQYADAVESKKIIFQQALLDGNIPEDTATILKNNGVLVGYEENGEFIENNKHEGGLYLKLDGEIITGNDFINEVNNNLKLYEAFNNATYSRAAYYYDEPAKKIFEEIGTSRNNYTDDSDFDDVMDKLVGKGSDIEINNVVLVEKTEKDKETGEETTKYNYEEIGEATNSKGEARAIIKSVSDKNKDNSIEKATLNAADSLKVADTVSKERRSSLFFITFMENISKMKAGDGNDSKISDALNYLYDNKETEIVDVKTGEVIKVKGTPLDSPSLYAVLSGDKIDTNLVANYSSDRILKLADNQMGGVNKNEVISETVASTTEKNKGKIGRFVGNGNEPASEEVLNKTNHIIDSSLINNSYKTISGIDAGEFMVDGAVNVGRKLAKASGATAGDSSSILSYNRLTSKVLAMDAKLDRINRSPFDITSRNTFLGSILYKVALIVNKNNSELFGMNILSKLTNSAIISLLPLSFADTTDGYLSNFGDCDTLNTIGAVGSADCSEIATFDISTLNDPLNNSGFIDFVNNNTTLNENGTREINDDSALAKFIKYNNERNTPNGVMDGGILDSLSNKSSSIPFLSSIVEMIERLIGASDEDKRIASGASFVNSATNPEWQDYKYAQRYVSLARATDTLRQYSSDKTAYNNIKFFEGNNNPVMAFLQKYYTTAKY